MKKVLVQLNFAQEEIDSLMLLYNNVNVNNFIGIYKLLKRYNCSEDYIRSLIVDRMDLFTFDIERLEYVLEAIRSNGDSIEEILLELV